MLSTNFKVALVLCLEFIKVALLFCAEFNNLGRCIHHSRTVALLYLEFDFEVPRALF